MDTYGELDVCIRFLPYDRLSAQLDDPNTANNITASIGSLVGVRVLGVKVGGLVGAFVGVAVGTALGEAVGTAVLGTAVMGDAVGEVVLGIAVGSAIGIAVVGYALGTAVDGTAVGVNDAVAVGMAVEGIVSVLSPQH